jgi:hypothetical protein
MAKYSACYKDQVEYEYCISSPNGWEIRKNHSSLGRFVDVMCIGVWRELKTSSTISRVHL